MKVGAPQLEVHHPRPVGPQSASRDRVGSYAQADGGEGYEGGDDSESRGSGQ